LVNLISEPDESEASTVTQPANSIVFGIYKCNGFVFTEIVTDVQKKKLQAVIRGRVSL
jgi:hypothetical protein